MVFLDVTKYFAQSWYEKYHFLKGDFPIDTLITYYAGRQRPEGGFFRISNEPAPAMSHGKSLSENVQIKFWRINKQTKITRKIDLPVSNDRSRIPRAKSASLCPSDIPLAAFQRLYSGEIRAEFKISPFFSSFKGNKRRAPQVLECIWTWRTTRGTPNWSDSGRFLWK